MTSVIVVKLGGSTLGQHDTSLDDIVALQREGRRVVVVHGGGSTISEWLDRFGLQSRFVRGLRVTDAPALDVVIAVLAGLVNTQLVAGLQSRGALAIGLSGADASLLQARQVDEQLGFVGELSKVDPSPIKGILDSGAIAVVAPIAIDADHAATAQLLNVNADTAAGHIAACLQAQTLVFLTDVPGVMDPSDKVIPTLTAAAAGELVSAGTVAGGMIPKVEAAMLASKSGVRSMITDGRRSGALLTALDASPSGTVVEGVR